MFENSLSTCTWDASPQRPSMFNGFKDLCQLGCTSVKSFAYNLAPISGRQDNVKLPSLSIVHHRQTSRACLVSSSSVGYGAAERCPGEVEAESCHNWARSSAPALLRPVSAGRGVVRVYCSRGRLLPPPTSAPLASHTKHN